MDIKERINGICPIEETAWEDFSQYFSRLIIKKWGTLWQPGDICRQLVFINSGLIQSSYEKDGEEIAWRFYLENNLFADDYSFISQQPCKLIYVALEETELVTVPRAALYKMYDSYKSFERLGRMTVESIHLALINDQLNLNGLKAEEKYLSLVTSHPNIIQRVPLKSIASYLNITPEHLSRIRRKLADPAA
jgi:CRP-like cAMP-binding protein